MATGDDNNPFVSAAAKEFGWVRPLVAFDPAQLSVRALEETLASVPRVAGVSLRGGDAAELLAVDPAVWRWLDARKWLISQNNRGEGWLAWLPVLQRTPGLRLLVAHCGLPLQAPPSERENPAPREVLHERLKTVLALVLGFVAVIGLLVAYIVNIKRRHKDRREELMSEIEELHLTGGHTLVLETPVLELNRALLDLSLGRTLNDTDWKVLNILLEDPAMTNRSIAERVHLSVDGIGSSLRRMYLYFDIKETKYKKMALLHAAMKVSSEQD